PEESPDPAAAAIWGLVGSAISEHPGRFALLDCDGAEASREARQGALALSARAQPLGAPDPDQAPPRPFDPERTVLITGATGTLGSLFARHLVCAHGARHLLLLSRSGPEAEGAPALQAELQELGASVEIAACDVADRDQLAARIEAIDPAHPLGALLHAAGVLEDATIARMTPEQLQSVFAAKATAACNLHELSRGLELSAFVLFSSAAGVLGAPGQGNYAAANRFLDALAQQRRAEGLAASSIAWGLWESESALTGALGEADRARLARLGMKPISDAHGLELFDRALASGEPLALALASDAQRLRALAAAGLLPALLGSLVAVPRTRRASLGSLGARLAAAPEPEREAMVRELVVGEVATVLGHQSPAAI